jgi:hypothetical protein
MFSIFLMNRCERRIEKEVCPWQMEGSFRHEVFKMLQAKTTLTNQYLPCLMGSLWEL